jgi:hypothetical protein
MPESDELIQRYLEGGLDEAAAQQLHERLQAEPGLVDQLFLHLEMDALLRASVPPGYVAPVAFVPSRRYGWRSLATVAALAACLALAGVWLLEPFIGAGAARAEPTTVAVAVLTQGVQMDWDSPGMEAGAPLAPGTMKLRSGIAQIEFFTGARVRIEGPAELELISSGEAALRFGKLSAEVPPQAVGFTIRTPQGDVVDLGTEFALQVDGTSSEVHVFKGEVEVHPQAATMRALKEGQAVAFGARTAELAANPLGFAALGELDARTADSQRSEFARWRTRGQTLNQDAGLLARFDFQDAADSRRLRNAVAGSEVADGSIVGATWTQGRWPGKQALEFRNVSDRVRLAVPGELDALTLSAWVRVHGLDRAFNSLFMSESWGDRRVHWQITREGRVRLGVAGQAAERHVDYDTPVWFGPERFGRWTHLAVVFDPAAREVRHYADGELLARLPMGDASPLRLGIAELGNWNDQRRQGGVAIRHLSGAMDEFALWQRPLAVDEIRALAR